LHTQAFWQSLPLSFNPLHPTAQTQLSHPEDSLGVI